MISRCARCGQRIRDCTSYVQQEYVLVTVPGWYHVSTGWELCASGLTRAWPVLCVDVACAIHDRKPEVDCPSCETSSQVSLWFHNDGRCIENLCDYPHA